MIVPLISATTIIYYTWSLSSSSSNGNGKIVTTVSATTLCEEVPTQQQQQPPSPQRRRQFGWDIGTSSETTDKDIDDNNDTDNNIDTIESFYYGLFPKRQLFRPKLEYPLWDSNWDGKEPVVVSSSIDGGTTTNTELDRPQMTTRMIRKNGITRHIILVRHGQYNETSRNDEHRTLTPLGIQQAHLTGQRLASMIQQQQQHSQNNQSNNNNNNKNGSTNNNLDVVVTKAPTTTTLTPATRCNIVSIRVSQLTRAQETASIIASYLPNVTYYNTGDANLNEGRPCHTIPAGGPASTKLIDITDQQHERIETAYQTYFYRSTVFPSSSSVVTTQPTTTTTTVVNNNPQEATVYTNTNNSTAVVVADAAAPSSPLPTTTTTAPTGTNNNNNIRHITDEKHEYEIIVCHANVIRYFLCRYVLFL
jgi:hypothetical protein